MLCGATSGGSTTLVLARVYFTQVDVLGSTMGNRRELQGLKSTLGRAHGGRHARRARMFADWAAELMPWIEDVDRRFELPPDTVYSYDAHTIPELRGRRVTPARASIALAELRNSGFRRGVAFVLPGNRSGERSRARSGWRRFGVAGYLNLGLARIDFIRTRGHQGKWRLRWLRSRGAQRPQPPPLESDASLAG